MTRVHPDEVRARLAKTQPGPGRLGTRTMEGTLALLVEQPAKSKPGSAGLRDVVVWPHSDGSALLIRGIPPRDAANTKSYTHLVTPCEVLCQ